VLPIQRWQAGQRPRWYSEKWKLRRGKHLFLARRQPGRLSPAARLAAHIPARPIPYIHPADPTERRRALADSRYPSKRPQQQPVSLPDGEAPSGAQTSPRRSAQTLDSDAVRTAIAVEPRDGRLCVFMPPVRTLEDYLELLAAAEARRRRWPAHPYRGLCAAARSALNVIRVAPIPASSR
jgi:uncharacterized protein (DUF2126 family)